MSAPTSSSSENKLRIGWIGCGVMGLSMCGHLLNNKQYDIILHTRTKSKAQALLDKGAKWAESPSEVTKASDVVMTMLGYPDDVRSVYFDETTGIIKSIRSSHIVIDLTTTEPKLAKDIFNKFDKFKAITFDCPVSGGDVGAKAGTLSIMVGGDKTHLSTILPILQNFGKTITYQGPAGSGQHTKMCNQIVIASTMVGVCESLLYGFKAGLDCETMLTSISGGAAACWTLNNLAPRILNRNFEPGFFVDHFIKDMAIALDEAKRMKISLPGLGLAYQLYMAVQAQGYGQKGTQGLMLALESLSNTTVKKNSTEEKKN